MDFQQFILNESLDKPYEVTTLDRSDLKSRTLAEYRFFHNNKEYAVRFDKAKEISKGNKALVAFMGIARGKIIRRTMGNVSNPRPIIATLLSIFQKAESDISSMNGFMITMNKNDYDAFGDFLKRYITRRFRSTYKVASTTYNPIDPENLLGVYVYKKSYSFERVFDKIEFPVEAEPETDRNDGDEPEQPPAKEKQNDAIMSFFKPKERNATNPTAPENKKPSDEFKGNESPSELVLEPGDEKGKTNVSSAASGGSQTESHLEKKETREMIERAKQGETALIEKYNSEIANALRRKIKNSFNFGLEHDLNSKDLSTEEMFSFLALAGKETKERRNPGKFAQHLYGDGYLTDRNKYDEFIKFFTEAEREGLTDVDKLAKMAGKFTIIDNVGFASLYRHMIDNNKTIDQVKFADDISDGELIERYLEYEVGESDKPRSFLGGIDLVYENMTVDEIKDCFLISVDSNNFMKILDIGKNLQIYASDNQELENWCKGLDSEFAKYVDSGMYIEEFESFTRNFVNKWAMTGGTECQLASMVWMNGGNNPSPEKGVDMWEGSGNNMFSGKGVAEGGKTKLNDVYGHTQKFLAEKYGKKYPNKMLKLYRGVGIDSVERYVPSAIESWSTQVSTAKKFAQMMARGGNGTVLEVKVPLTEIWATFESLKEFGFPPEEDLKGKKEHILLGPSLSKYPVKIYKEDTVVQTFESMLLGEEYMNEAPEGSDERESLKVVFANDPEFPHLDSETTGYGLEPNEGKTRGKEDDNDRD